MVQLCVWIMTTHYPSLGHKKYIILESFLNVYFFRNAFVEVLKFELNCYLVLFSEGYMRKILSKGQANSADVCVCVCLWLHACVCVCEWECAVGMHACVCAHMHVSAWRCTCVCVCVKERERAIKAHFESCSELLHSKLQRALNCSYNYVVLVISIL